MGEAGGQPTIGHGFAVGVLNSGSRLLLLLTDLHDARRSLGSFSEVGAEARRVALADAFAFAEGPLVEKVNQDINSQDTNRKKDG